MCGRYALHTHPDVIALMFGLSQIPAQQPRYNIAPTSQVLIIRNNEAAMVRWGLVPRWAKDPSIGAKMNNARAETVAEKPSFREAYRKRRCLVPASGYYEWKLENGVKQPYYDGIYFWNARSKQCEYVMVASSGRTIKGTVALEGETEVSYFTESGADGEWTYRHHLRYLDDAMQEKKIEEKKGGTWEEVATLRFHRVMPKGK